MIACSALFLLYPLSITHCYCVSIVYGSTVRWLVPGDLIPFCLTLTSAIDYNYNDTNTLHNQSVSSEFTGG